MKIRRFGAIAAIAIAVAALCVASPPAKAATYNFTFTGGTFGIISGVLTTNAFDDVLTIAGNVTGPNAAAISGLEPPGNPNWTYDQKFFAFAPHVDNAGILFDAGAWIYNLYSAGPQVYLSTFNPNGSLYNPGDAGSLSVSQTPLPAAALLFGSVLGIGGLVAHRRRKKASAGSSVAA